LDKYPTHDNDQHLNKKNVELLSWFAKAIAFSGQEKYLPTLETIKEDTISDKIKKYAQLGIKLSPKYKVWNEIIVNDKDWNSSRPPDSNRFLLMIKSNDIELLRLA
jgi:hypothetical protein